MASLPTWVAAMICLFLASSDALRLGPAPAGRPPHVIVFLVDDWGHNDLGMVNQANENYIQTPFLDSAAKAGVWFTNAYVQPICSPTRSQLLSGRYQIHTGLQHGVIRPTVPNHLPLNISLIPQYLKRASVPYATAMVGKWHVGFDVEAACPWNRGFDKYTGYLIGAEDYYEHTRSYGKVQGYDMRNGSDVDWNAKGTYSADLFTETARRYIFEHAKEHGNDKPLFLYVPLQNVHAPLQAPPGNIIDRFRKIGDANRRTYAAMMLAADTAAANITQAMKDSGLMADDSPTVLFAMQDNGGQVHAGGNNWPLRGNKGTMWEGGMKTRLFAWGTHPDVARPRNWDGMWHVSDLLPTIAQGLAGVDVSREGLDGINQWPAIASGGKSQRTEILHNIDPISHTSALRVGDMKLLLGEIGYNDWAVPAGWTPPPSQQPPAPGPLPATDFVGLFNITEDPREFHNLASSMPDVVASLRARLYQYNATAVPCRFPASDPAADPAKHGGAWGPWH